MKTNTKNFEIAFKTLLENSKEEQCIFCDTEQQADILINFAKSLGYSWRDTQTSDTNYFDKYEEMFYFFNPKTEEISYSNYDYIDENNIDFVCFRDLNREQHNQKDMGALIELMQQVKQMKTDINNLQYNWDISEVELETKQYVKFSSNSSFDLLLFDNKKEENFILKVYAYVYQNKSIDLYLYDGTHSEKANIFSATMELDGTNIIEIKNNSYGLNSSDFITISKILTKIDNTINEKQAQTETHKHIDFMNKLKSLV